MHQPRMTDSVFWEVQVRIAYLLAWRGGNRTGPFKKIEEQTRTWRRLGHDVRLFVVTSPEAVDDWASLSQAGNVLGASSSMLSGLRARRDMLRCVREWAPDAIYLRLGLSYPGLTRLTKEIPTVAEVNGDERVIARESSRLKYWWARVSRGRLLGQLRGLVFVSGELARSHAFGALDIPRVVVPNGIELDAFPQLPPNRSGHVGLMMLGHPDSPWHGTDKLVPLARTFPGWRFHLVGPRTTDIGQDAPSNMTLHDELSADEYQEIMAACDVGIGTLAMHRIGGEENPALKVREYLARGLAVIVGCHDPDFPDRPPFLLQLPNTQNNVINNTKEIQRFVELWHGKRVNRTDVARLDVSLKEPIRLEFLRTACAGAANERTNKHAR